MLAEIRNSSLEIVGRLPGGTYAFEGQRNRFGVPDHLGGGQEAVPREEHGFAMSLPWNVVGFLARVTEILATAGIAVGALSAFSRDHLLIKQEDLGTALRVLGEHVAELC